MSSKGDEVMKKLKNLEKGKGISELVDALKSVDIKSVNTRMKLNEISMEDSEGRRIYYFLTDEEIRKQNIGKNDFNPNETKTRAGEVLKRFLNVAYIVLILMSIFVAIFAWLVNKPVVNKNYSYIVTCDNGKTFDPTSKPIDSVFNGSNEPRIFDNNQLKSECEYNTAYLVGLSSKLQTNYKITNTESVSKTGSLMSQILSTVLWLIGYLLVIEIISRTFIYIIYGQKFFKGIKK